MCLKIHNGNQSEIMNVIGGKTRRELSNKKGSTFFSSHRKIIINSKIETQKM